MKLAGAYINDDTYERLVALAMSNNRTLAGQCRHLFDRALKGELQVPDAPCGAGQPAGRKPVLEGAPAAPRGPKANPQPKAAAAARALPPGALPGSETLPVTGVGVGVVRVMPVGAGRAATRVMAPVTGQPRPAKCAGGGSCAQRISTHTPTMMKTHNPNAQRRGRCRPGAPAAPGTPAACHAAPTAPGNLHTHGRAAP